MSEQYNQGISIENDAVLPAQFFARARAGGKQPEEELLLAIVSAALSDLQYDGRERQQVRRAEEAIAWVLDHNERYPFSFAAICAHFDWPTERLRTAIMATKHRGRPKIGGPLPRGISYEGRCREPYRVALYIDGKQQIKRFGRLDDACGFLAQTRDRKKKGIDWSSYPPHRAGSILMRTGPRCRICDDKILRGEAYRGASRSGLAHDTCWQKGEDDEHQERVPDSAPRASVAA